jgi:flagellar biosynthesis protein FliR
MTDWQATLQELGLLSENALRAAALVFLRIGAAMALLPGFGDQSVPQRVRLALALAFTAVVLPAVLTKLPEGGFLLPAASEVVAGLALGAGFRLFVLALVMAGNIVAQATSLSQAFGNAGPEPQPAVSQLFTMAALALAAAAGLHVRLAETLILSYHVWPVGAFPTAADFAGWGLAQASHAFALAFTLAAPFTIAALLYNLALGVINRAMPSLMVSFIGAPALAGGGIALLALLTPLLLGVWLMAFGSFLTAPFELPG